MADEQLARLTVQVGERTIRCRFTRAVTRTFRAKCGVSFLEVGSWVGDEDHLEAALLLAAEAAGEALTEEELRREMGADQVAVFQVQILNMVAAINEAAMGNATAAVRDALAKVSGAPAAAPPPTATPSSVASL